jgi:hypothetical protein
MDGSPQSFPDATGKNVDEAVKTIQDMYPSLKVEKIEEGRPVTRDFRMDRVRVFYDKNTNLVVGVPKKG